MLAQAGQRLGHHVAVQAHAVGGPFKQLGAEPAFAGGQATQQAGGGGVVPVVSGQHEQAGQQFVAGGFGDGAGLVCHVQQV